MHDPTNTPNANTEAQPEVRAPWAPPVISRFAIDRTQGGGGSPTDGTASGSSLT